VPTAAERPLPLHVPLTLARHMPPAAFYTLYYLSTAHAQAMTHPHITEAISKAGKASSGEDGLAAAAAPPPRFDAHTGDPSLDTGQRLIRAAFYIWVNVQNLVAISAMWARCADVFSSEAASRLFGVISAGATVGQLVGSLTAVTMTTVGEAQLRAPACCAEWRVGWRWLAAGRQFLRVPLGCH
jgi:hypothetical protein